MMGEGAEVGPLLGCEGVDNVRPRSSEFVGDNIGRRSNGRKGECPTVSRPTAVRAGYGWAIFEVRQRDNRR